MDNRHEFNLYLSANHQFNSNLVLIKNFNLYLNNNIFNITIDDFDFSETLIARFIQTNIISISQIFNAIRGTGSFANTSKMEINENNISLNVVPLIQFSSTQRMSASPLLIENIFFKTNFEIKTKFEENIKESVFLENLTNFNNILNMTCASGVAANYYLVSDWDFYSASSLDTKTINEMEYAYV